jgi:serine phosphatase RsbU (regulator of sigma subunit)
MVNQVMELRQGVIRGSKVAAAGSQPRDESAAEGAGVAGDGTPAASGEPQMGAPLTCRGESLGTVHLEAAAGSRPFTQEGLALLQAIARQAAAAIASARAGQALLSQQRLEDDLRLAREIQRRFLPQTLHQVRGLRFDTHYAPANQVGGDFYDIIPVGASLVAVLIGDISGHGVSSALLMAKLATDIRIHACMARSPGEVLTIANQALTEAGHEAMFATVLFLLVDLEAQTLTLANAGHQPPLVISERFEGVAELEEATAVALGVVPGMDYPQKVYELKPGDVVLLYTDGINEAKNRQGHDFGMDRLLSVLAQGPPEPSALVTRVMADVRRFVGGAPQSDDQTLVAFGLAPAG